MADFTTKKAFQQPTESPAGTIANSDWVIPYGDPIGVSNMLNIPFTSLFIWIWNLLTNQNSGKQTGDFVLTNKDNFASLSDKPTSLSNLGGRGKYLSFKRNFTSAGGGSTSTATIISTPVNYDILIIKGSDYYKLPLIADDITLVDGQLLTLFRTTQPGDPAIRADELSNYSLLVMHDAFTCIELIYDSQEDRWRVTHV
jgi:hypothetical protein